MEALTPGSVLDLSAQGAESARVAVRCATPVQRNWSRVGGGQIVSAGAPQRVFLKQFVDARGRRQEDHWRFEREGALAAERVLAGIVRVPRVLAWADDDLVLAFEHVDVEPMDELLRADEDRFQRVLPAVLAALAEVLRALAAPPTDLARGLTVKERPYGSGSRALNFKGLDVRNVGVTAGAPDEAPEVVLFDFGRPYLAPIEEAVAKLLVSVGLLNWGRPTRRFLRGPDARLVRAAAARFGPALDAAAVHAELALQRSFRFREFQGGPITAALKRAGIGALGARYVGRLEHICAELAREVPA